MESMKIVFRTSKSRGWWPFHLSTCHQPTSQLHLIPNTFNRFLSKFLFFFFHFIIYSLIFFHSGNLHSLDQISPIGPSSDKVFFLKKNTTQTRPPPWTIRSIFLLLDSVYLRSLPMFLTLASDGDGKPYAVGLTILVMISSILSLQGQLITHTERSTTKQVEDGQTTQITTTTTSFDDTCVSSLNGMTLNSAPRLLTLNIFRLLYSFEPPADNSSAQAHTSSGVESEWWILDKCPLSFTNRLRLSSSLNWSFWLPQKLRTLCACHSTGWSISITISL